MVVGEPCEGGVPMGTEGAGTYGHSGSGHLWAQAGPVLMGVGGAGAHWHGGWGRSRAHTGRGLTGLVGMGGDGDGALQPATLEPRLETSRGAAGTEAVPAAIAARPAATCAHSAAATAELQQGAAPRVCGATE